MLGRYELLFMLGQGGMGEVHLARLSGAGGFEKLCIVKTILPQMQADPQFVDRFHHEARVLVNLTHSNIAQVYDMGEFERTLYMAIEYVPGVDLARVESRLSASGSVMPLSMALYISQQIAEALGYAHRKIGADGTPLGIVHRDVSPQNVMVSYEGEVKVIDFGLAKSAARSKHTLPSTVMGKLGYMSPEQAMAQPVDHRSDIFSAGIVVWEMIAGRPLYAGATMGEMVAMMARPTIPSLRGVRPEVSPALEQVVMRALATDPANRYSRCDEFARSLNELAVREQLTMGAEDVGNAVRAMCADEFAAERQLQSKLSLLRRRTQSASQPTFEETAPVPGTFLRDSDEVPLTPAQRALSAVATPRPKPPSTPRAAAADEHHESLIIVPKSRAPALVVGALAVLSLGAVGFWAIGRNEGVVAAAPTKPAVVVTKPEPEPVPVAFEPKAAPEPVAEAAQAQYKVESKRDLVVPPPGTLFKVTRKNDSAFLFLEKNERVEEGERFRLVGEPIDGAKRELYGTAAVYRVKGALAEIVIEQDETDFPKELFAFRDLTVPVAKVAKKPVKPVAHDPPAAATITAAQEPVKGVEATPTTAIVVATSEPQQAAAQKSSERRVIKGDVRIERRRRNSDEGTVAVATREADVLAGCTVWLPNGRSKVFSTLAPGKSTVSSLESFRVDPRPLDPNLRSRQYALTQCEGAAGYFYFTDQNR